MEDTAYPVISPDGRMLCYSTLKDGRYDLFVRRVAGGEPIRLTDNDTMEYFPEFSPDGERIAYAQRGRNDSIQSVYVIPTFGGIPKKLIDRATQPTWSPDARQIAVARRLPDGQRVLDLVDLEKGSIRTLLTAHAAFPFIEDPSWSPSGEWIAVVRNRGGNAKQIWLVSPETGELKPLLTDTKGVFQDSPVFTSGGRDVVFASNRAGASNLWMKSIYDSEPVQLTSGPGPDETLSLSLNGDIAFVNAKTRTVLSHSHPIWAPAFSPDGDEITFSQNEVDGAWHIWAVPTEGGPARQITDGPVPELYSRYSPNGRELTFHTWSVDEPNRLWKMSLGGGPPTSLTPASREFSEGFAEISPDGKSYAFTRSGPDGTHVFVSDLEGGGERRLTSSSSDVPRWSPNGEWIAFAFDRGYQGGIFLVRPDGSDEHRLTDEGGWPVWWPDGSRIGYLAVAEFGGQVIRAVPVQGGTPERLTDIPFNGTNYPFDISPDGSSLVTSNNVRISTEIWLLETTKQPGN